MITSIFILIVYLAVVLVTLPLRLFSDAVLPQFLSGIASTLNPAVAPLSMFLPLTVIFSILVFFIVFEGAILTWHGINWLMRRFPTQS